MLSFHAPVLQSTGTMWKQTNDTQFYNLPGVMYLTRRDKEQCLLSHYIFNFLSRNTGQCLDLITERNPLSQEMSRSIIIRYTATYLLLISIFSVNFSMLCLTRQRAYFFVI